jgi:hypothetical protein
MKKTVPDLKTFRDAAFGASRSESYGEHHFGAGNPNYSKIVRFANVNRSQSWAVANSGGTAEIFRPVFYRTFLLLPANRQAQEE